MLLPTWWKWKRLLLRISNIIFVNSNHSYKINKIGQILSWKIIILPFVTIDELIQAPGGLRHNSNCFQIIQKFCFA